MTLTLKIKFVQNIIYLNFSILDEQSRTVLSLSVCSALNAVQIICQFWPSKSSLHDIDQCETTIKDIKLSQ